MIYHLGFPCLPRKDGLKDECPVENRFGKLKDRYSFMSEACSDINETCITNHFNLLREICL